MGQWYGNMGPFDPVSIKGNARIHGVPTFVKELPLTKGGIAGADLKFGRIVSMNPNDRRTFVPGIPTGNIVQGLTMLSPTQMVADPGMNDYYFAGRPVTVTTMGLVDILEYDITQSAPVEGSTVWCRNTDGVLAFNNGTDISASGYTKLNAFVYETYDPNGAKVWFGLPLATQTVVETTTQAEAPVATPAAGAVTAGTQVVLESATPGSVILYTLDGSAPTESSMVYNQPIDVTAAVTIKAVAIAEGKNPSSVLTAAYTIA